MTKPWIFSAALAMTAVCAAMPAVAQQSFAAPEGCEAKLTVQHKCCVCLLYTSDAADDLYSV